MAHNSVGVHSIRFNHDFSCFAVGMDQGCRIFNVVPFREKLNLPHDTVGSVYICEMLHRSNLLAIVGGGVLPKFADNALLLWDDAMKEFVYELTFDLPVLAVRMRRDLLIAVLRNRIHVFTFPDPVEKLLTLDTRDNPRGLCALSRTIANQILGTVSSFLRTILLRFCKFTNNFWHALFNFSFSRPEKRHCSNS